jgi:type IV pilus assembly protein PilM
MQKLVQYLQNTVGNYLARSENSGCELRDECGRKDRRIMRARRRNRRLIGIDINFACGTVKMLELRHGKCGYVVERCSVVEANPCAIGCGDNGLGDYAEQMLTTLKKMAVSAVDQAHVAVALPLSAVISKEIMVSLELRGAKLEEFLQMNLEKYIGCDAHEVRFDYQVLGRQQNMQQVFLVACRKMWIEKTMRVLQGAGIAAKIIDVDAYALARAVHFMLSALDAAAKDVAVFNIEYKSLTVCFLRSDNIVHAHSEVINLPAMKNDPVGLVSILSNTLRWHLAAANFHPQLVLLCGDVKMIPQELLRKEIAEMTKSSAIFANPFAYMQLAADLDEAELADLAPRMMVCLGLTLHRGDHADKY